MHFHFQEHAGRGLLIVNKNGRAFVTHVDGAQSVSTILFLDVSEAVSSRCMDKKHPRQRWWGQQTFGLISEFQCTVCSVFSAAGDSFVFESSRCTFVWRLHASNQITLAHQKRNASGIRDISLLVLFLSIILLFRSVSGSNSSSKTGPSTVRGSIFAFVPHISKTKPLSQGQCSKDKDNKRM